MKNRLAMFRSDRLENTPVHPEKSTSTENDPYSDIESPTTPDYRNYAGPPELVEFFNLERFISPPENIEDEQIGGFGYEYQQTGRRRVLIVALTAVAFTSALFWGVQGQLGAEKRRLTIQDCINEELGDGNISLVIDGQRGNIIVPKELQPAFDDCK